MHSLLSSISQSSLTDTTLLFLQLKFETTHGLLIYFTSVLGLRGAPVESQQHPWLTMADNPLSVALPPSPPSAVCSIKTGVKDGSMTEKTSKIGQEMTEFKPDVDSFDQDDNTSGFDSTSPNTLQLAEGVHDTGIMEAFLPKTATKNGQKLTAFLMADDHTRQGDSTLLSVANFNTACSPIPLITGYPKNIDSAEVPMTEITTRKGQNLTNFLLDNAPIDCNKNTLFSDALFDPALLPSVPKVTPGINNNNNFKDVSMVRNTSNNQQKMTELIADDASTNLDNNTLLPT